jgi:hypothetical protein
MVLSVLKATKQKVFFKEKYFSRKLTNKKLATIINDIDFLKMNVDASTNINDHWDEFKNLLLNVINKCAPQKQYVVKRNKNQKPWFDNELKYLLNLKLKYHSDYKRSKFYWLFELFKQTRKKFNSLENKKKIDYFRCKGLNDFDTSKLFWQFYSKTITIKSCNSTVKLPPVLSNGTKLAADDNSKAELFNEFFTSIVSMSTVSFNSSVAFIVNVFSAMSFSNSGKFKFNMTNESEIMSALHKLKANSGCGISEIPTLVLKLAKEKVSAPLCEIINRILAEWSMPNEWKTGLVTPLFKNVGNISDINNYRSITILSPIAKLFERIIVPQIKNYFNANELFYDRQYGFRPNHSVEFAFHDLVSELNNNRNNKLISMVIFIDFRKAFDIIDHNLLLQKLKMYNFDDDSLNLIESYLYQRKIITKINNSSSTGTVVSNGVPQGSVIGPLLFLIFINDLPNYLVNIDSILFADDTTIYFSAPTIDELMVKATNGLILFCDWCVHNRLDINIDKTFAMFVTDKRISKFDENIGKTTRGLRLPESIVFDNNSIKVVKEHELLGINLNCKLDFHSQVQKVKRQVNIRTFAFGKLHYFSFPVKLQFLKTFILPLFDYCSTLCIYWNKQTIQKLARIYHYSIYRLIKFDAKMDSVLEFNNFLKKYGLQTFQHRITVRLLKLVHNIFHNKAPRRLFGLLEKSYGKNTTYELRNKNMFHKFAKNGHETFINFYADFINQHCLNINCMSVKELDDFIENKLDVIVADFISKDERFAFNINFLNYHILKKR